MYFLIIREKEIAKRKNGIKKQNLGKTCEFPPDSWRKRMDQYISVTNTNYPSCTFWQDPSCLYRYFLPCLYSNTGYFADTYYLYVILRTGFWDSLLLLYLFYMGRSFGQVKPQRKLSPREAQVKSGLGDCRPVLAAPLAAGCSAALGAGGGEACLPHGGDLLCLPPPWHCLHHRLLRNLR